MNIGTLQQVAEDMKKGVMDFTKDGECSQCGQCCSNLLPLTVGECKRIREYVRRKHIRECVNIPPTVVPVKDFTCPFRDNAKKICTIYEIRPAICQEFRCDKPKKEIEASRAMCKRQHIIVDMRETFFPKE